MSKWEYELVVMPRIRDGVEEMLNKRGQSGWELCGIDYGCFIFKRPIVPRERKK